ncbi:MAG TPA: VOC family protein [Firmicutes bacterium]|nr:VOC family protein [Bacillota bacterium]
MTFKFAHNNINVYDLEKSLAFYEEMLGLKPVKVKEAEDKSFKLVFLGDKEGSEHKLEITWLRDRQNPYELGDNEIHLAFTTDDFEKAYAFHKEKGVVCYENTAMGVYFISDPDGYWLEIVPAK